MEKKPFHHDNLKLELIEKGIELINQEGIKDFSLRKVAAACEVTHSAPYNHFENKDKLLEGMQAHVTESFSQRLENVLDEHGTEPDLIKYLGIAYVQFFIENPQYFSFLYLQSNFEIDLSLETAATKPYKPFEIYKNAMLRMMESSGYPVGERKNTIIALWAYVHGIASLATMKNVYFDENWEDKIEVLVDMFKLPLTTEKR